MQKTEMKHIYAPECQNIHSCKMYNQMYYYYYYYY